MALAISSSSSNTLTLCNKLTYNNTNNEEGAKRKKPPIFISTNPSSINLKTLTQLYVSCNHSPHRFPTSTFDIDTRKLAKAVHHSSVVVSVFAKEVEEEREKGLLGMMLTAPVRVSPENGELVGFGRAYSDMGLTASIHDVIVFPSLQRLGIGRMIVQRIVRMLTNKGIYDISALCSDSERSFFAACGFGDDPLGATTMMYTEIVPSDRDNNDQITTQAGRKLLVAPPWRLPF